MHDIPVDIDLVMLEGLRELLNGKFVELVTTYNTDCGKRLERIQSAIPSADFAVIRHEAHGLKGSSRNIGANSLAACCEQLEAKAQAGDTAGMEQIFSAMEQQFAAVSAQLNQLIA